MGGNYKVAYQQRGGEEGLRKRDKKTDMDEKEGHENQSKGIKSVLGKSYTENSIRDLSKKK